MKGKSNNKERYSYYEHPFLGVLEYKKGSVNNNVDVIEVRMYNKQHGANKLVTPPSSNIYCNLSPL